MTATAVLSRTTSTDDRLRRLLRADAAVTAAVGAGALFGPDIYGSSPDWLPRLVGGVLLVVAADLVLASRWSGRRLRLASTVCGELALIAAVALAGVIVFGDLPASGREVLGAVALVTAAFGVAELRAVRATRATR